MLLRSIPTCSCVNSASCTSRPLFLRSILTCCSCAVLLLASIGGPITDESSRPSEGRPRTRARVRRRADHDFSKILRPKASLAGSGRAPFLYVRGPHGSPRVLKLKLRSHNRKKNFHPHRLEVHLGSRPQRLFLRGHRGVAIRQRRGGCSRAGAGGGEGSHRGESPPSRSGSAADQAPSRGRLDAWAVDQLHRSAESVSRPSLRGCL